MQRQFQNPKIHSDLCTLYRRFFMIHKNMSKYLRVTILEQEILQAISNAMKITIEINITRPPESFDMPRQHVIYGMEEKLRKLRALIENIKAFTTLLWQLKAFKEGFYIETMAAAESISKQILGWQNYLIAKNKK